MENEFDILWALSVIADILQVANYDLNTRQLSNDELLQEFTKATNVQTKLLLNRIESKLDRILDNQAKEEG